MALTKPRIIELLLVTTVPTMIVAEQGMPSLWLIVCTVLGGTLAAGGANAINMYVDRDIDRLMERTKNRPLVTGAMTPRAALTFAIALEVVAFVFLWATVNLLSAVLAVAACLFYVFVYTLWLKRTSSRNIVIGGAAGAVPALIGWSSVTGTLDWAPVVLFAIIFYWTPPALLGPGHPLPGRLRRRRRADAPGRSRACAAPSVRILAYTLLLWALTVLFSPGRRAWATSTWARRSSSAGSSPGSPCGSSGCPIPGLALSAVGRRRGARGAGHRDAPVHLVDHLHHAAVRGHGGRPAAAVRMVIGAAARRVRRRPGSRD